MTSTRLEPDSSHPITVVPTGAHVVVRAGGPDGAVVAETDAALTLQEASYAPVHYVPLADVDPGVLRATATSTYCPYKGDASYWTLTLEAGDRVDAVWGYPTPYDAVAEIAGHVAFAPDQVDITVR